MHPTEATAKGVHLRSVWLHAEFVFFQLYLLIFHIYSTNYLHCALKTDSISKVKVSRSGPVIWFSRAAIAIPVLLGKLFPCWGVPAHLSHCWELTLLPRHPPGMNKTQIKCLPSLSCRLPWRLSQSFVYLLWTVCFPFLLKGFASWFPSCSLNF